VARPRSPATAEYSANGRGNAVRIALAELNEMNWAGSMYLPLSSLSTHRTEKSFAFFYWPHVRVNVYMRFVYTFAELHVTTAAFLDATQFLISR